MFYFLRVVLRYYEKHVKLHKKCIKNYDCS